MSSAARIGSGAAWESTAALRNQFIKATMEAMPARTAEASAEFAAVRAKFAARDVTVNELGIAAVRAVEFYAFYLVGRAIGSRTLTGP
jgi:Mitochondrial ATP synthase g subunit